MKPRIADPINSEHRLVSIIPRHGKMLLEALENVNQSPKKLPEWRTNQILNFISAVRINSDDLIARYKNGRIDALSQTTRNLMEVCIWIQYCNLSELHAKTFYEDSVRDVKEIMQSLLALYTSANGAPEQRLVSMLDGLRTVAADSGFQDFDRSYK
ncbi:MAG: hypothetical protein WAM91_11700, partial [Candidatus Acidiferrales bacterium]